MTMELTGTQIPTHPQAQGQGQRHPFHPQHFALVQIQTTTITGGMVLNLAIVQ